MFFVLEISGKPQAVSVDNIRLHLGSAPVSAVPAPRRGCPPQPLHLRLGIDSTRLRQIADCVNTFGATLLVSLRLFFSELPNYIRQI
jgi:hypothetical protein